MLRHLFVLILGICLISGLAARASATSYALLVGVSDYDDSIGLADLRGPANDVRLLRDVLRARDDFDIRVMADQVEGGVRPTRAAILGALDALVAEAVAGDFVYIHMSGHGTQQADREGDETDGLDEVFLPADTRRAEPGAAVIPNAIVDEELGVRIAALRANGVDVWFVLDSCHSGSGLRAASPRTRTRFVDPAVLGLTLRGTPEPATTAVLDAPGGDDLPGRYLAFYAAQASELAREIEVDESAENGWYGLFTSRLAARLQTDQSLSYRQLFQAVLSDLNDASVPGGARLQTPLWEGNLVDAPVFGGGDLVSVRQFAVDGGRLEAGLLHGLVANTVVALVDDAAASADDILGYAQLDAPEARSASLVPVTEDCVAQTDRPCLRAGALAPDARFARLVAKPRDAVLRIAPPVDLTTGEALPSTHPLAQAFTQAVRESNADEGTYIQIDQTGAILSGVAQGRLWFGPKLSAGGRAMGLGWSPEAGPLVPLLVRIARAEEVARILSTVAGTPSLLFPSPIKVEVQRVVSDIGELQPSVPEDLRAECRAALRAGSITPSLPPGQSLKQCDQLAFGGQGAVQGPARDVNRVYIDSQYCVSTAYQRVEGVSRPAVLGPPLTICSDCPAAGGSEAKAGAERLFIVVTEAAPNTEALNLENLLDTCGDGAAVTRSATARRYADDLLGGLARTDPTRGGMGGFGISNIWVEEFNWQVLPRRAARAQAGLAVQN